MPGIFIVYEKVSEEAGRILSTSSVADDASHAAMLEEQGILYEYIPLDGMSGYIKIEGNRTDFALRMILDKTWSRTTLAPIETATLSDVPPGSVQINGPISAIKEHPGGDLTIGFALPGLYQVYVEAFPYRTHFTAFNVEMPTAGDTDVAE